MIDFWTKEALFWSLSAHHWGDSLRSVLRLKCDEQRRATTSDGEQRRAATSHDVQRRAAWSQGLGSGPARAGLIWATYHLGQVKGPFRVQVWVRTSLTCRRLSQPVGPLHFLEMEQLGVVQRSACGKYRQSPAATAYYAPNNGAATRAQNAPGVRTGVRIPVGRQVNQSGRWPLN